MTGFVVHRYSNERSQVEIVEVVSYLDGTSHLVNARELRGGKVWLNTFDRSTFTQTSEMVSRFALALSDLPMAA